MLKKNQILNFDCPPDFAKLLAGRDFDFPLNEKTVKKINCKKTIRVITLNSTSKINHQVLNNFPNLKLLITRSTGIDHVNLTDCKKHKTTFKNLPDYGSFFVAEHAFALLLSLTGKIITLDKKTKQGNFNHQDGKSFTLQGKTFGCIGTGRIGQEAIKIAKAFKMKILAFDVCKNKLAAKKIGFQYRLLDTLLRQADVISLHVPLTEKTHYLINTPEISKMKKGVILINTSRGAIINTKALIRNIKKFRFVGLDVLENENR